MKLKLTIKNLTVKPLRNILTVFAITISIAALTLFAALNQAVTEFVFTSVNSQHPLNQLTVSPQGQIIGYLNPLDSFEVKSLTNEQITALAKIPHVENVYPQNSISGISSLQVNLLGQWFQTDSLIFGLPFEIFDNPKFTANQWSAQTKPIPIVLSSQLLDLYNFSFASINNVPNLQPENLVGTKVKILLNKSTFINIQENQEHPALDAEIVGFSDKVKLIGITIPSDTIEQIKSEYLNQDEQNFLNAYLTIDSQKNIDQVSDSLKRMKLDVTSFNDNFNSINNYFRVFSITLSIISITILLLTALMIGNTFAANLNERVKDIGILRALGTTKSDIAQLFLLESGLLGIIGGIFGYAIAWLISIVLNSYLQIIVADLVNKPDNFFQFGLIQFIIIIAFSILLSLLAAFIPARKAAQLEPLKAIYK